ncbi:hypothetical protein [Sphingobium herbicidovorans]
MTRWIIAPRLTLRGFSSNLVSAILSASERVTFFASLSAKQLVATKAPFFKNCRYDGKTPVASFGCIYGRCTKLDQYRAGGEVKCFSNLFRM